MRAIPRYVVIEVLKVFFVALTLLTVLMIAVVLFREANAQGLEPRQIMKIMPYLVPEAMRYAVPATILFAVCSVYGRIAGANELVALKSVGINPMTIIWPVFVLALLISIVTVWLNDAAVSWGRANMRRIIVESVEEIAYGMLRTNRSFSSSQVSIIVKGVEDRRLIEPTITFQGNGNTPGTTLTAEEAELQADTKASLLTIVCRRGTLDVEGQVRYQFDTFEREMPLDATNQASGDPLPSQLLLSALSDITTDRKQRISQIERRRAAKAVYALLTGDFAALTGTDVQGDTDELHRIRMYLHRLETEPHRRWSGGFSCLCFVLIGAPVAMRLRNSDFLTSFFLCFGPIVLVYYPLLLFGIDQAKSGKLPAVAVWLGNVVLFGVGAWLMRKVIRY